MTQLPLPGDVPERADERARELLVGALDQPPDARSAFLLRECGGDAALRSAVLTLLRAHEKAEATFASEPPLVGEQPGDRIGRYRLLHRIGEGGFGVVWMAEQLEPVRRKVALKVLKPGMDTAQVVARFEAERQALALMDHDHIAKVFDGGATGQGRPYFVMELVHGVPITRYCDEAHLSPRQRLELFLPVCAAVQHAHQKGVIHRDLKPGNVLVTLHDGAPVPKVIDFGIAKATAGALTERTVFTEFRQMLGTPEYMAPEQAEMSGLDVDTRADIYSLGVLLYELLTGTRPFELKTLLQAGYAEMLRTIREVDPPKPSTRISTLGDQLLDVAKRRRVHPRALSALFRGDLDWIVMKALEKERGRRYDTAAALADDVLRHLQHEPVRAGRPGGFYRLHKYVRRHQVGVAAATAIIASLVLGLMTSLYSLRTAREQEEIAHKEATAATLARLGEEAQRKAAEAAREGEATERRRAEDREREARAQAQKAHKVTQLLERMLASSDPHQAKGANYPVRLLLDEFAGHLSDQLAGEPAVEADLRQTIGMSYLGLGLPRQAEPHLARALALRRQTSGERSVATADAMLSWAGYLHAIDDFQGGLAAGQQALELLEAHGEAGRDKAGDVLRQLADLCVHLERHAPSLEYARRAAAVEEQLHGDRHDDVGSAHRDLATALAAAGQLQEARQEAARALLVQTAVFGAMHPSTATCHLTMAEVLLQLGDPTQAEAESRQALAIRKAMLPADHPETAHAMSRVAAAVHRDRRFREAADLYREAIAMSRRILGVSNIHVGPMLHNLGSCLLSLGEHGEAEKHLREALDICREMYGPTHREIATCLDSIGQLLLQTGRAPEAASWFQQALDMTRQVVPPGHGEIAIKVNNLAVLLVQLGDYAGAERAAREAQTLHAANLGKGSADYAVASLNLACALSRQGKPEAEPLLRDVVIPAYERLGNRPDERSVAWGALADLLLDQRRLDEAGPCFQKALGFGRKAHPQGSASLAMTLSSVGGYHLLRGDLERAEATHRECLDMLTRLFGPDSPRTTLPLLNLATTHNVRNAGAEAEALIRRALTLLERSPDPTLRYRALTELAKARRSQGDADEAVDLYRQAIAAQKALFGQPNHGTATMLSRLGAILLDCHRAAEAQTVLEECLQICQRTRPGTADLDRVAALLGRALLTQGDVEHAEPLLRQAAERGAALEPAVPDTWRGVVQLLIGVYEQLGRQELAARWRQALADAASRPAESRRG